MSRSVVAMLALVAALGASVSSQQPQRVLEKIGPNDYDVVPNWSLPYPKPGYAWGSVPGVFVESDDRIFVASRGEIKLPDPLPPGYLGFFGSIRSALGAKENEVRNCLRVLDSNGRILETWAQWDKLFEGTNGPHKIKISPYDRDGKFVMSWGGKGTEPGQFGTVHGIDVDRNRRVYVADRTNKRVQVFDENGKHLATWPNIRFPNHIFVSDATQDVWVADNMTAEVLKFDTNGNRLFSWDASGTAPGGFGELHQAPHRPGRHADARSAVTSARDGASRTPA